MRYLALILLLLAACTPEKPPQPPVSRGLTLEQKTQQQEARAAYNIQARHCADIPEPDKSDCYEMAITEYDNALRRAGIQ